MSDKAKDPRFSDASERLDALLSDFLSKEIPTVRSRKEATFPTNVPLGDPFSDPNESQCGNSSATNPPASESRKVAQVKRADFWASSTKQPLDLRQTTPEPAVPASHQHGERIGPDEVERLERALESVLSAQEKRGGRRIIPWVLIFVTATAGTSYWVGTRQARLRESGVAVRQMEPSVAESALEVPAEATPDGEPAASGPAVGEAHPTETVHGVETAIQTPPARTTRVQKQVTALQAPEAGPVAAPPAEQSAAPQFSPPQVVAPVTVASSLPVAATQDLKAVHMEAAPSTLLPLPPSPAISAVEALKKGGSAAVVASPAVPLVKVSPVYPEMARKLNQAGTVEVILTVDASGKVTEARAVSGSQLLRGAAEQAVRQWQFKPAMVNGQAVVGKGRVSIVFNPRKR